VAVVVSAGALDRGAAAFGLQPPFVGRPAGLGWNARPRRRGDRVPEQVSQPGPGGLPVGELAALLGRGQSEHAADQTPGQALERAGPRPVREHGRMLYVEGELDPAVGGVDRLPAGP
jgi:hypothetical protein